jgi:hypothetical protein
VANAIITTTTKTITAHLTAHDIVALIQGKVPSSCSCHQPAADLIRIPEGARNVQWRVGFVVPSGADWSGMRLDLDDDNPVVVHVSYEVP